MAGPVASSPSERAILLCGAETFWNSLADSVSSSFPSPQSRLANFALPAKVRAKALTHPEGDREEEILLDPSLTRVERAGALRPHSSNAVKNGLAASYGL